MEDFSDLDLGQTIRGFSAGQKVFRRYALVRILGRGGMGVVWLARDEELQRDVALKFLPELVMHDLAVLDELKGETRRSLELTHHNIVRIYDFVQDTQSACISMEYVDGPTLSALRVQRENKVFEVEELAPWIKQMCEALDYAHQQAHIVHRDVKPANLMLNSKSVLKVADFGIARTLSDSVSILTMARGSSGTLVYMSPQQLAGDRASHLDDIYSLGATIYELLTSKPPFYSGAVETQIREKIPPSIFSRRQELNVVIGKGIPQAWEEAIAACLEKDPAKRPTSAMEVARGFELVRAYEPKAAPETSKPVTTAVPRNVPRRSRGVLIATVLGLLLIGGAWAGWWFGVELPQRRLESLRVAERNAEIQRRKDEAEARTLAEKNDFDEKARAAAAVQLAEGKRKTELAAAEGTKRNGAENITAASKEYPWENSLGMKFVPMLGTQALFSIWETRVQDYEVFAKATGRVWPNPPFQQGPTHPAVNVSWDDATAFCNWLTQQERAAGRLGTGQEYRLPIDEEWSVAVGLPREMGSTPEEKDGKIKGVYPWGKGWPPPKDSGNYASSLRVDEFVDSSAVGSFRSNGYGLYDLGGNVWEWCQDWWNGQKKYRVLRGASWRDGLPGGPLSSFRSNIEPGIRRDNCGFRCVLSLGTSLPPATAVFLPSPPSIRAEVDRPTPAPEKIAQATKEHPYENGLGMKFVPVPGANVLFSVWDTRRRDFRAYVEATSYVQKGGIYVWKADEKKSKLDMSATWEAPGYKQTEADPVVGVSWEEANAFCEWLTMKDQGESRIGLEQRYRLPTDEEWSAAVGKSKYPWGNQWPPPKEAGNYPPFLKVDRYANTSPVGTFSSNRFGLYDLGGNVYQWCEDWYRKEMNSDEILNKYPTLREDGGGQRYRVLRGASWRDCEISSFRNINIPGNRCDNDGFRCVLVVEEKRDEKRTPH